jgi:hypothetical protein
MTLTLIYENNGITIPANDKERIFIRDTRKISVQVFSLYAKSSVSRASLYVNVANREPEFVLRLSFRKERTGSGR